MLRRTVTYLLRGWALVACLVGVAASGGCGGDEGDQSAAEPVFDAPAAKDTALEQKLRARRAGAGMSEADFVAKPEWDMLSAHFHKFVSVLTGDVHSKSVMWKFKDAFATREEKFYPSVVVEKKTGFDLVKSLAEKGAELKKEDKTIQSILDSIMAPVGPGEGIGETEGTEPKSPLVTRGLNSYNFKIIMTGIANPEALVEDTEGNTYLVHVNDKIGSEGGYIAEIFKHKILVRIPDQPEAVELSLAPESLPDTFAAQ